MTENNLHHKIKMNKKVILLIVTFSIIATPAIAFASTPPWWQQIVGDATQLVTGQNPISKMSFGLAGLLLSQYGSNIYNTQSNTPASTAEYNSYIGSVFNSSINSINELNSSINTESNLLRTSYYYFGQIMTTQSINFLNESSLNETYVGTDSGAYASADNLSASVIYPLNNIFFNDFIWEEQNSYPTMITQALSNPTSVGNPLTNNSIYFIIPNSNFYFIQNSSFTLTNILTGIIYNVSAKLQTLAVKYMQNEQAGNIQNNVITGIGYYPEIASARSFGIPLGIYRLSNFNKQKTGNSGTLTSVTNPALTDAIELSSTGSVVNDVGIQTAMSFTSYVTTSYSQNSILSVIRGIGTSTYGNDPAHSYTFPDGTIGTSGNPYYVDWNIQSASNNFANLNVISSVTTMENTIVNIIQDAYNSAIAYFNQLHSMGYFSASSVPASLITLLPSFFVPNSILNGTFNATEVQSLYVAYLLQLKSWLNETSTHTLKGNMTVTNSTFDNGFVQVYGNLENNVTSNGKIYHYYYNNTWFVPLINLDKWTFKVHSWTNITNNTPDPNFLIVSGSDSGTLVNVVNGTFYTDAILVNGTSTSSYTITQTIIQYVLPHTVSIGKLNNGGFLFSKTAGLQNWELILAGIITVIGIAIIFDRKD